MARARLSGAARSVLELLASCPDLPADVVSILGPNRHVISTQQLLSRLNAAELVRMRQVAISPVLGFRSTVLWSVTKLGLSRLESERYFVPELSARTPLTARSRSPSLKVASAWMLAALVAEDD